MKLFDLHCDTLYECCETGKHLRENDLHVNRAAAQKYEHYVQFFALFCGAYPPESQKKKRSCLLDTPKDERLARMLQTAQTEFAANADWLTLCRSGEELTRAAESGKAAAFLSIEGAELLPEREGALDEAYDAGVRLVTLTWNYRSRYGCSSAIDQNEGLTDGGRQLVRALDARRMLIDVSHLSDRGFWDVCGLTDRPFVATHSDSRALCRNSRNLTDEQFAEIAQRGGLVGINLYTPFLVRQSDSVLDDAIDHIERFIGMYGEKIVALGCDLSASRASAICTVSQTACSPSDTGRRLFAACSMTTLSRLYRKCCDNRLYFFAFRYCRTIPVCYTIIRYGFSMRRSTTRSIQYHCGGYDKWIM